MRLDLPVLVGVSETIGLVGNKLAEIELVDLRFDIELGNFFLTKEVSLVKILMVRCRDSNSSKVGPTCSTENK